MNWHTNAINRHKADDLNRKYAEFEALYQRAHAAGVALATFTTPTPMIVGEATTLFGSDIDYSKPTYYVADGMCGFAWVNVKPGTSAFAKWLVKTGKARPDSYYKGVSIWVHEYNQSITRKEAHARAFAKVLTDNGIEAYADSRLD